MRGIPESDSLTGLKSHEHMAAGTFLLVLLESSCMKVITKVLLLALVVMAFSTSHVFAQKKRADKTSSAKAYYGQSPSKPSYKSKKTKANKTFRSQSQKRTRAEARNRKKYSRS
jgi:hypothetical protein